MTNIPPTIPFKVANAYGVRPVSVRPVPTPAGEADTSRGGVRRGSDQLLAGSVRAPVSFDAAPAKANTLAFYRHPADTNAAATAIDLGRKLDVEG
ncbi:MAG: hypothetical protein ACF8Q5_13225 [Phycisphaerales bacterium JB040]